MRWMTALNLWEPTPRFDDLLLRNAAAVIGNYLEEGVDHAILSGGVFTQAHLDRFLALVDKPVDVRYFWLEIPGELRAKRLVERARDSGDSPETVPYLISNYTFSKPFLEFQTGRLYEIDTATLEPEQVVAEILERIRSEA